MKTLAWRAATLVSLALVPAAGLAAWRSEGPAVANITALAVDPVRTDTIYAAASAGGVWRSDDGGRTWTLPGGDLTGREVEWIEVDPSATVWAGIRAPGSAGLWRSPDRGKSWAPVRVDPTSHAVGQRIAIAASDPRIVYVPSTNLHFRSADGGKTWQSFRVPGQDVYAFAIHPQKPTVVYAGGRGSGHNLSRSQDGGRTWRPFGQGLAADNSIKRLQVSPARASTLYAIAGFGRLHKSEDEGETWTELELGLRGTDALFSLGLDPHDPEVLWAATPAGLRRSVDGGRTWTTMAEGLGGYVCKALAFHPARKGTLYAGAAGSGFFTSSNGGRSFAASITGLNAGWTERLFAPPSGTAPIFAQMSAGLFRMDAPGSWTEVQAPFSPGEPAEVDGVVFDRDSPKRVYAHKASRWWRSEDAGRSWSEVAVPEPSMKDMMKGKLAQAEFKSLVQDPLDAKTFYAGCWSSSAPGAAVFKTTNAGKKWEAAGSGLPAGGAITLLRSAAAGTVFAVAEKAGLHRTTDGGKSWNLVRPGEARDLALDPTKPERVFVATEKGLFRSLDAGGAWTRVSQGIEGDEVAAVVVSRDGQVFAGTFQGVFRSTDGGTTWSSFGDGLLNADVRALAIAGGSPARLFAGLAGGSVFSTELPQ